MLLSDLPSGIDTLVRYGELLSGLDVGILSHSPDGIAEYANDAARNWLGFGGLSGLGLDNTWSLLEADGSHLALSELPAVQVLCTASPVTGRVVGRLIGGELHLLRMDAIPVPGFDGRLERVVTAFRDVSAGRRDAGVDEGGSADDSSAA